MSVLTLPGDNGTWSVVLTTASRDRQLHALRESGGLTRVTAAVVEPLYRTTLWFDRNRLAEIDADAGGYVAGTPGQTDDSRWAASKALFAASLADQDLAREYLSIALLLSTPTRCSPSRAWPNG